MSPDAKKRGFLRVCVVYKFESLMFFSCNNYTYHYLALVETYANWLSKVHQKTRGFLEIQFGSG